MSWSPGKERAASTTGPSSSGQAARLGLLRGEPDLDHDLQWRTGFGQAAGHFRLINRLDHLKKFGGFAGLVRLQMADEMKAGARQVGELGGLVLELLDVVLAELAQAGMEGLDHHVRARTSWLRPAG